MGTVLKFAACLGAAQVFVVLVVVNLKLRSGEIADPAAVRAVTASIGIFALLVAVALVARHLG